MKFWSARRHALALVVVSVVNGLPAAGAAETRLIPDLKLALVPIAPGSFTMGSPVTEVGRFSNEGPQTRVTITRPFWLGTTAVTHSQWQTLMGTDLVEQVRKMLADDQRYPIAGKNQTNRDFFHMMKRADPHELVYNADDDAPIYWVNWDEAVAFCHRLTARERAAGRLPDGYEYRLPTEAEWEYACRAGTTTATYAGDLALKGIYDAPVLDAIAWYGGNSSVGYVGHGIDTTYTLDKEYPGGTAGPHAVGTKRPNDWGLYDMIGNVYQWCSDWYANNLLGGSVTDPTGPATGIGRVSRGSSWGYAAILSRSAHRDGHAPGLRNRNLGFRVELGPVR